MCGADFQAVKCNGAVPQIPRPLMINFINFKKALGSVHRETPWAILRTYGIPQ